MTLDTTFLRLHPRTALWWEQREQCRVCSQHAKVGRSEDVCLLPGNNIKGKGRTPGVPCITSRDEGSPCGPGAARFTPKEEAKP